jgi:NAD(P)-dependent dehydrogenase (short-subunit alcohol dehydrogenase family)
MVGMTSKQIAVVVGGAGGIGAAIVRKLALDGYHVVCTDRAEAQTTQAGQAAPEFKPIDITDPASVDTTIGAVAASHGRLDVMVNAAGIHMQKLLVDTTPEEWDRIHQVNARGPFLTCRAAARPMMRARKGRLINLTTRLGFGNPYSSAYIASKNALWGLTQCLAVELAGYGITVNAVAPGHVGPGTGMERQFRQKAEKLGMAWEDFEAQVIKTIPVGRWCRPEDVAAAVSWVASPAAAFITGETINVTGGFVGYGMAPPLEARFTEGGVK